MTELPAKTILFSKSSFNGADWAKENASPKGMSPIRTGSIQSFIEEVYQNKQSILKHFHHDKLGKIPRAFLVCPGEHVGVQPSAVSMQSEIGSPSLPGEGKRNRHAGKSH